MPEEAEKLRADARANRDRILDAAREALAADPAASLNSIGKLAGVGPGTLYRHFPSREALVLGVYRKEISEMVALAPALLTGHTPLNAFRIWCDRLAEFGRLKYGVADFLQAARSERDVKETYGSMLDAVRTLMTACENAGEIHSGTDAEDFLTLVGLLWRIPPTAAGQARVRRLLELAFRGLGAPGSPE